MNDSNNILKNIDTLVVSENEETIIGKFVYILLPNRMVIRGKVLSRIFDGSYRIETDDGPSFSRFISDIYITEDIARAKKFIERFKIKLNHGFSLEDAWDSEDKHIIDLALEKWPEKFL